MSLKKRISQTRERRAKARAERREERRRAERAKRAATASQRAEERSERRAKPKPSDGSLARVGSEPPLGSKKGRAARRAREGARWLRTPARSAAGSPPWARSC